MFGTFLVHVLDQGKQKSIPSKRQWSLKVFGLIFILLALHIPISPRTYMQPKSEQEAVSLMNTIMESDNLRLEDIAVEKVQKFKNSGVQRFKGSAQAPAKKRPVKLKKIL